ncbi:PREDICTED: uncharacterized protein LOC106820084 [Priapulus caudatus]|uniref:Uncharacterized protein LOC106820084 n=1 Tax=Priapulus caudatus TaxID=37621 RepID=A0ABM1F6Q9_PRICU|nr:PREDICTED: uncharacterized protein LOC106820084 [Priapulus caudatus]
MALPKLSKEVYELETDDVHIEYCLDIPDMAKLWFEKHPEWPIIGAWVVDQGASLMQNIGFYKWGSHEARRKVIDSCIQGDNKESTMYSMMKMGPMMRAIRFSTYQKLLDIDSDMPTKPG